MQEYSQADLKRLFALPGALVRSLAGAGYITPTAASGKTGYSFQDLLVLRMAGALKAAKISSGKITAALGKIRATLPPGSALTSMALEACGKEAVMRDGASQWEANSGQYTMHFSVGTKARKVASLSAVAKPSPRMLAESHFARGAALEDLDAAAARAAYLAALNVHSDHLEARINLGRLLHLDGQLHAAEELYRQARSSSALLSFNLAILLEDLDREAEAIAAYREALAQDPLMHDAHFNLSRLHERANQPREALRHLLAYRRHVARHGE